MKKLDYISSEPMLLLWSMKERYNSNSKFKIYFETLPEKFGTGMLLAPAKFSKLDVEGKVFSQALKKNLLPFMRPGYPVC